MDFTDNFLDKDTFLRLQNTLLDLNLAWYFAPYTDGNDGNSDHFFLDIIFIIITHGLLEYRMSCLLLLRR